MKIGFVDLKSASVHFHAANIEEHGTTNKRFTFKSKQNFVNVGNGFDWDNQWFLVPYNGTYVFSLSGSKKGWGIGRASVLIRLNGKKIGEALSSETRYGGMAFQVTKKLKKGDKIELLLHRESEQTYLLYFTGYMLEQELTI